MSSKFSLNNFTLGAFTTELGKLFQTLVIRWKNEHLTVLQIGGCTNTFKLWPRMITLVLKMSDVRSKGSELCKISYALYCTLNYKLFWAYVIQVKVSLRK